MPFLFYRYLIVATGMWKPNVPEFKGSQFTTGYEEIATDSEEFEGQTVLILGKTIIYGSLQENKIVNEQKHE